MNPATPSSSTRVNPFLKKVGSGSVARFVVSRDTGSATSSCVRSCVPAVGNTVRRRRSRYQSVFRFRFARSGDDSASPFMPKMASSLARPPMAGAPPSMPPPMQSEQMPAMTSSQPSRSKKGMTAAQLYSLHPIGSGREYRFWLIWMRLRTRRRARWRTRWRSQRRR